MLTAITVTWIDIIYRVHISAVAGVRDCRFRSRTGRTCILFGQSVAVAFPGVRLAS